MKLYNECLFEWKESGRKRASKLDIIDRVRSVDIDGDTYENENLESLARRFRFRGCREEKKFCAVLLFDTCTSPWGLICLHDVSSLGHRWCQKLLSE